MTLRTRLTERFGIAHPVIAAPMAFVSGGRLAAAVSAAGGLGLIGGGYCDPDWIEAEYDKAGNADVGCGFITWRLDGVPGLLERVLARAPRAVFLSFGDPAPHAAAIRDAGAALICQVQTLEDARRAVGCGAEVIVAQGAEAGGHGQSRATMTLVPEIADWLAGQAPEVLLAAAGGIADGRGLAAALMLGADGVVCGTRFWAAEEALTKPAHLAAGLAADGDATLRTKVIDIVRGFDWPERFDNRVLRTGFISRWDRDAPGLRGDKAAHAEWVAAFETGDTSVASATVGEGIGLVHGAAPAGEILEGLVAEAQAVLAGGWQRGAR